jgi:hypothetical protein
MKSQTYHVRQTAANRYTVYLGGHLVVCDAARPFHDAAVVLMADGACADDLLVADLDGVSSFKTHPENRQAGRRLMA